MEVVMVRYLQRLKAKKGFTIVELIVVIAIIAVLSAVIFSNMGTENERKQAANTAARDFYSTVQYSFTKYMKYEAELSIAIKNETPTIPIIKYEPSLNGNFPLNEMTFIKMFVDKNQIQYVQCFNTLKNMLSSTSTDCITEFDKLLVNDFDTLMESNVDGYYYAMVTFDGVKTTPTTFAPVKVHSAYYCSKPFVEVNGATDDTDYSINNLKFEAYCRLSNGNICGVCSSKKYTGVVLGEKDTYFMGANGSLNATLGS